MGRDTNILRVLSHTCIMVHLKQIAQFFSASHTKMIFFSKHLFRISVLNLIQNTLKHFRMLSVCFPRWSNVILLFSELH